MSSTKQSVRLVLTWVIVFAAFAGCQSDLQNSASELSAGYESGTPSIGEQGGIARPRVAIGGVVWGLVTPLKGGTLHLSSSKLVVYPMAVTETTLVTFSITEATPIGLRRSLNRVYDFTPDGLHFLVPSTLYVSFSDAGLGNNDPEDYWLCYWNPGTRRWEEQPTTVDMLNHQFIVRLNHFSRYAFGR